MIYGYTRVSTRKQVDGYGLEVQKKEILSKYSSAIIIEEQYTGTKVNRPLFNELLNKLEANDILVVSKLDRFARNTVEGIKVVEQLFKKKVAIHILNVGLLEDTPMGRFFLTTMLAVAELERNMIVERTQTGKSQIQVNNIIDGSGDIPFFTSGESILYTDNSLTNGFNIFLSTGGNAKVQSYYGNVSYSTDTWCITSKNNLQYYLYGYLKHIENQMDKLYFHGTGLKHLQKPLFLKSIIEIPNNSVIQKFNLIVEPMYIQISKLTQSNVKLQRLKNKLLPLLINQQLL